MSINVARLPYKLVESLAQGLPELITSPSFRVIFIFIRSTVRSDCNFVAFVSKLIGKELVVMPIVTSAEKEMLKRGSNEQPQTEKM